MKCPICDGEMEEGKIGAEPPRHWAGCDGCGFYTSARTEEELKSKLEKVEIKQ